MENLQLYQGDCLEIMQDIPPSSVDLVLVDPPYGTMKGAALDGWNKQTTQWDMAIPPAALHAEISRVLRPNGKAVIFAQEPYTSNLITSAIPPLPFCYRAMWYKNVHANALLAKSAMVNRFEDILIFSKIHPKHDFKGIHPLRTYSEKVYQYIGKSKKEITETVGQCADHFFRFNSTQFTLCTEATYRKLINLFHIDEMKGFTAFADLQKIDTAYRAELIQKMNGQYPSVFNLWEGGKSKSNVLEYAKDNDGFHPTQKPVALLEDLIKTYTNPGNLVLDCCMGSGSTGVACLRTGRRFIGIEKDPQYYQIAKERLRKETEAPEQMMLSV